MKFFTIALFLLSGMCFGADSQQVLEIINSETKETAVLSVTLDEENLAGFELKTKKKTKKISLKDASKGKTLLRKRGVKVISIKARNLKPDEGGRVTITYLKKFRLFGSKYGRLRIKLQKLEDSWQVFHKGDLVTELIVTPHSLGISSIELK